MRVVFSFDTEDYVTPEAWDAQKWWAGQLVARGLRGSFQCVGELVRRLRANGRQDVIDALGRHEIGFHGNLHSVPPAHPVATAGMSLPEAVAWILRRETAGFASVAEAFGRVPVSAAMNGDTWTPAGFIAMNCLGMRVYAGAGDCLVPARWYCGMLVAPYAMSFEAYYGEDGAGEDGFKEEFERTARGIGEDDALIVFTHPTRLVTAQFWDRPYYRGATAPIESLAPAPLWPEAQRARIRDRVQRLLDWIVARPGVRPCDLATWYAEQPARRDMAALLRECGLKPGEEAQLPLRDPAGASRELLNFFDTFRYGWSILPEAFDNRPIMDQARRLAWTCG